MNQDIRRELIRRNLAVRPVSHGQLHTSLIAIPAVLRSTLTLERRELLESSLMQHHSNLIPLVVRRTEAYGEEFEYEIVWGAEWLQVAQELNIETLWTWVFDMTDEQAEAAQLEMQQLLMPVGEISAIGRPDDAVSAAPSSGGGGMAPTQIIDLMHEVIDRKLNLASESIKQSMQASLNALRSETDEKLKNISYRLSDMTEGLASVAQLSDLLAAAVAEFQQALQRLDRPKRAGNLPFDGPKLDLQQATDQEIEAALRQVGAQTKQVEAALKAIDRCKHSEEGLTWRSLERSSAKAPSSLKVAGFAKGTLDRLRTIGQLPGDS